MDKVTPLKTINLMGKHINQVISQLENELPNEACGLIAGQTFTSKAVFPIENTLKSPVRFRMNPKQQIKTMIEIENNQWDLLAIYHSHPNGPAHPSKTDLQEGFYPNVVQIIFSFQDMQWSYKGFIIKAENFHEIQITII